MRPTCTTSGSRLSRYKDDGRCQKSPSSRKTKVFFSEHVTTRRAGHFRYFWILSLIKNDFVAFFIKLITYFCTSSILKNHLFYWKCPALDLRGEPSWVSSEEFVNKTWLITALFFFKTQYKLAFFCFSQGDNMSEATECPDIFSLVERERPKIAIHNI